MEKKFLKMKARRVIQKQYSKMRVGRDRCLSHFKPQTSAETKFDRFSTTPAKYLINKAQTDPQLGKYVG